MISAQEAIARLKEGNERFVSGSPLLESLANPERRSELESGQEPFAIILGCSDSRVPSEIVFDFSLGHLFVIRVAGNIVAPSHRHTQSVHTPTPHTPHSHRPPSATGLRQPSVISPSCAL